MLITPIELLAVLLDHVELDIVVNFRETPGLKVTLFLVTRRSLIVQVFGFVVFGEQMKFSLQVGELSGESNDLSMLR